MTYRRNNHIRFKEVFLVVGNSTGKTAVFDKETKLLLTSFDLLFTECYELMQNIKPTEWTK